MNLSNTPTAQEGFDVDELISAVNDLTVLAKDKLQDIKDRGTEISIADMFDMQMRMNHLAKISESSTAVVNACNTAIMTMARNVKG